MIEILEFLSNVWPYVVAVIVFLVLIVIHEFGHFIAAKSVGVRVNEFAVGFGPKILSRKKGETTYMLKLIPFGGYCAMEGEDEQSDDERAFCNKKAWKRAIVVVMGAVFNILLGFILVGISLLPQERYLSTTVGGFAENSVSNQYGLKVGDKIVEVEGRDIYTSYDLSYAFTAVSDDGKLEMVVERDGKRIKYQNIRFETEEYEGINYVEVDFGLQPVEKTFGSFMSQTFLTTLSYGRTVWFSLVDLISGKFGISAVSGPVGVTEVIGSAAKENFMNIIPIMALITINLGIFNLLPLPALDGGRLIFIFFEMIFRKPVPKKFEGAVHAVGLVLLLLLMVAVTAKDILALVV